MKWGIGVTTKDGIYQSYIQILKEELMPAMGCTEPIALAYAAAKAREVLGLLPQKMIAQVSSNIVKNVKSVVVPNTGGRKGIETAIAAGVVAGVAEKKLEVIASVTKEQQQQIAAYLDTHEIVVEAAASDLIFDIFLIAEAKGHTATVRIANFHTNIVLIEKDGEVLLEKEITCLEKESALTDRSLLNVQDIVAFADCVQIEDIEEMIGRQIAYNYAIAQEGMCGEYGANIGKVLLETYGNDVKVRARAMAAAGSDARMSGCELPVIILSGSGNQGMAASVPVIVYAEEKGISKDRLYRALVVSDLITIHQKTGIGRLSAFCGAVSAGCGSGCGIAYLLGGGEKEVAHTLVNALAIVSGIICDGAKASCAAKIAAAVDAGILGYSMYCHGKQFRGGDGIVKKGVEATIANVGRLGREGMKETDKEIIKIMTE